MNIDIDDRPLQFRAHGLRSPLWPIHWFKRSRAARQRQPGAATTQDPLLIVLGITLGEASALLAPNAYVKQSLHGDAFTLPVANGTVVAFSDGLLEDEHWHKRWAALWHQLAVKRGSRPADGVVIVLQADALVGPNALSFDAGAALGGQLRDVIEQAQQLGGWRLPVHLVIDHAESLQGFGALAAALSAPRSERPFGGALEPSGAVRYRRGWITTLLQSIADRAAALIAQWPAGLEGRAEEATALPAALRSLAPALSAILNPLIGQGTEQQDVLIRGLYFTGRATAKDGLTYGESRFSRQLLSERMFPERVFAHPTAPTSVRWQRRQRVAKTACAVATVLSVAGVLGVWHRQSAVEEVQRMAIQLDGTLRTLPAGVVPDPTGAVSEHLLAQMPAVSINRLETPWAPLSWAIPAGPSALDTLLADAYGRVVIPAIHDRLEHNIPLLLDVKETSLRPVRLAADCASTPGAPADAAALQALTAQLDLYARQAAVYQSLPANPDVQAFGSLIRYALHIEPPRAYQGATGFHRAALAATASSPLNARAIRASVDNIVRRQFAVGLAGAYPASALAEAVNIIEANAQPQTDSQASVQSLSEFAAALHVLQRMPAKEGAWLTGTAQAPAVAALLDRADALSTAASPAAAMPLLDADVATDLRAQAVACRDSSRRPLLAARAIGGHPVLAVKEGSAALSPALLPWLPTLDAFLALPLMTADLGEPSDADTPASADTTPLYWDLADLRSVQASASSYLTYLSTVPAALLPAELQAQLRQAAGEQLDRLTDLTIARAQSAPEETPGNDAERPALHAEISRFASAAPILIQLQESLKQADRVDTARRLDTLLAAQATALLEQLSSVLEATNPYRLAAPSLAFWKGVAPLAAPAFGATTADALVASLPGRRGYVASLSQDAAPLLAYLQQSSSATTRARATLIAQWQAIATQLARQDRGDTSSSVTRLEHFIQSDMDEITYANCAQRSRLASAGNDWFAGVQASIGAAVSQRCHVAIAADSTKQYSRLAAAFNQSLAMRFPFGPPSSPDADPADVRRFFDQFGAELVSLRAGLATLPIDEQGVAPQLLDQLIAVQTALAPMLGTGAADAPLSYDVAVQFRTNVGQDPGADQLTEQILILGAQSLSSFSSAKTLAWVAGQPAAIRLTWAANAPNLPTTGASGIPTVSGATAEFRYTGPWALLRLIASQRPSPSTWAQLTERGAETIALSAPLRTNPFAVAGGDAGLTSAVIFIQLKLSASIAQAASQPGRYQGVVLPSFPRNAPPLAPAQRRSTAAHPGG